MWKAIFASAGRADDLLIFSPDNPLLHRTGLCGPKTTGKMML